MWCSGQGITCLGCLLMPDTMSDGRCLQARRGQDNWAQITTLESNSIEPAKVHMRTWGWFHGAGGLPVQRGEPRQKAQVRAGSGRVQRWVRSLAGLNCNVQDGRRRERERRSREEVVTCASSGARLSA